MLKTTKNLSVIMYEREKAHIQQSFDFKKKKKVKFVLKIKDDHLHECERD